MCVWFFVCVCVWGGGGSNQGADFRPEYARLAVLKTWVGEVPMVALTATASESVRRDIMTNLALRSPLIVKTRCVQRGVWCVRCGGLGVRCCVCCAAGCGYVWVCLVVYG